MITYMIFFWSFFSIGVFTSFLIGVFTSFFIGVFTFFTGLGLFLLPFPSDVEDVDRGALRTKKDLMSPLGLVTDPRFFPLDDMI